MKKLLIFLTLMGCSSACFAEKQAEKQIDCSMVGNYAKLFSMQKEKGYGLKDAEGLIKINTGINGQQRYVLKLLANQIYNSPTMEPEKAFYTYSSQCEEGLVLADSDNS